MVKRTKHNRRVSQQDIAREANVSRVTVSLVLAGKDQTSTETRQRVLEAAKRLRYRPNLLVQGMQTGRSGTIGVIIPVSMQFQGLIAQGIHDELIVADYVPIQLWTNPTPAGKATELEQIHRLVDRRVDGVIIWPADASVPDVHFGEVWERNIPLVTVDRETTTHADHVGTDEEVGGRLVAEHLLGLGHRRFAHLTFPNRTGSMVRRRDAFVQAVKDKGGECKVIEAEREGLREAVQELLRDARTRPTAIFGATDPIASRVYTVAAELGLRVPQDVSVVGYANFDFARDLVPPLTSVHQDPYRIGRLAGKILLERILEQGAQKPPQRIHLKPELIVRKSTASPART